jgi:hypothetical protein
VAPRAARLGRGRNQRTKQVKIKACGVNSAAVGPVRPGLAGRWPARETPSNPQGYSSHKRGHHYEKMACPAPAPLGQAGPCWPRPTPIGSGGSPDLCRAGVPARELNKRTKCVTI